MPLPYSVAAGADAKEDATEAVEEGAGSGSACPAGALMSPVGAPERAALPALLDGAALLHAASRSEHWAAAASQKENFFIRGASLSVSILNFCTAVFFARTKTGRKGGKIGATAVFQPAALQMFHVEHFTQRQANLLPGRRMPAYKGCRYLLFQSLILCTVNWARPTLARKAMKRQTRARMFARPLRGKRENTLSARKKNITK